MRWTALLLTIACSSPSPSLHNDQLQTSEDSLQSSKRPGMGAYPYDGGTMFRVWAPGAARVFVMGDWNGWTIEELGNEFNGNFSGDIAWAAPYQKYKLVIENQWGGRQDRGDPRAFRVENSSGASIIPNPSAYWWRNDFHMVGHNELVIYEMHIGTFNDAPGWGPGHWKSAEAKLDHLRYLGVSAIELMPIAEFPGDFSWGYNPAYPFAPESAYGTPEDMKHFVDEAHGRGIAVFIDVVHNHYGPNDLPMWCFAGDCLGKGGHYFYTDARAQTPWGDTRPDYGRGEVRDYIKDSIVYWLDEYHLDGIRMDGTKYMRTQDGYTAIPDGFTQLQYVNDSVHARFPWKVMIAEDFGGGDSVTQGTDIGGAGFDAQWDGTFVHPIRETVIPQDDSGRDMWKVKGAIAHRFNGQASQRIIYTENHDEVANGRARVPEEIWPGHADSWYSRKRSTLAAGILFTTPGIPLMFQGQEMLEDGHFRDDDPLDWGKADRHGSIVALYRDLIHLRRNWFGNTAGLRGENVNVYHVNNSDKVVAYHRWDHGGSGDDVVIVANFSTKQYLDYIVGMPAGGKWHVRFNSDSRMYSGDYADTFAHDTEASGPAQDGLGQSARVNIGAYSVVILSQ